MTRFSPQTPTLSFTSLQSSQFGMLSRCMTAKRWFLSAMRRLFQRQNYGSVFVSLVVGVCSLTYMGNLGQVAAATSPPSAPSGTTQTQIPPTSIIINPDTETPSNIYTPYHLNSKRTESFLLWARLIMIIGVILTSLAVILFGLRLTARVVHAMVGKEGDHRAPA